MKSPGGILVRAIKLNEKARGLLSNAALLLAPVLMAALLGSAIVSSPAGAGELPSEYEASGLHMQQTSSTVTLAVVPGSHSAAVGDVFTLTLQVEAGTQRVDGVQVEVSFPPALLEVVDADPATPGVQISGGAALPTKLFNSVDNSAGNIKYVAGTALVPGASVTGTFALATVQFRAEAAGAASIQYGGITTVTYEERLPVSFRNGTVTIQAAGGSPPAGGGGGDSPTPTPTPTPTQVPAPSPALPQIIGPALGASLPDLAPLLRWQQPSGTTQFQVRVTPFNDDGPGINLIIADAGLVASSQFKVEAPDTIAGTNFVMLPGMTYRWSVRLATATQALTENASEWGPWSQGEFRTPPPSSGSITLASPGEGGTVATLAPSLTWANTDPNIFYYEVQVSKDPTFNNDPATATAPLYWNLVHGGVTTPPNTYTIPMEAPLKPGAGYYWRARPRVQGDGTPIEWSTVWSFRTP